MPPSGSASLRVTVLGSGTSVGVPTIGCPCDVCHSSDPRDRRLRPSIALQLDGRCVLVDTGPDLREQVLRADIRTLDAVLYTHAHADHILGLDDLRPFNYRRSEPIPIWASADTIEVIRHVFAYIFHDGPTESSRPKISPHTFHRDPFDVCGLSVTPVPLRHGSKETHGFRIGRMAYLTDHSAIPEGSLPLLADLDVLFLDALRHKPHPTHSTVEQSLRTVELLRPRNAYFTHISHELPHEATSRTLPEGVGLAYDGMELEVSLD